MNPTNQPIPPANPVPVEVHHHDYHQPLLIFMGFLLLIIGALGGFIFANVSESTTMFSVAPSPTVFPSDQIEAVEEEAEASLPRLDEFISYTLPKDWVEGDFDAYYIELASADAARQDYGLEELVQGGNISISRNYKEKDKTMAQQLEESTKEILPDAVWQPFQHGNVKGLSLFSCWEGACGEGYYIEDGDYIWSINFMCAPNCDTKAGMDASKYAAVRDSFIASIKFKNSISPTDGAYSY